MAERSTLRLPLPSGLVIVTFPSMADPGDLKTAAAALCVLAEWWSDRMERPWSVPMPRVVLPALEAAGGGEG